MGLKFKNYLPMINSCLGTALSADDLLMAGERIWNRERLFNLAAGFDETHDTLPECFLNEPVGEGPAEGQVSRLQEMRPAYYQLRGWSDKGEPLPETLNRLGLEN
jgi:aldehyde:ferredoxin oxidoreductase